MIEVPAVGRVAEAGHEVQGLRPLADELDRTAAEGALQASIAWTLPMTILALSRRLSSSSASASWRASYSQFWPNCE